VSVENSVGPHDARPVNGHGVGTTARAARQRHQRHVRDLGNGRRRQLWHPDSADSHSAVSPHDQPDRHHVYGLGDGEHNDRGHPSPSHDQPEWHGEPDRPTEWTVDAQYHRPWSVDPCQQDVHRRGGGEHYHSQRERDGATNPGGAAAPRVLVRHLGDGEPR
jgi:hypothetical protein